MWSSSNGGEGLPTMYDQVKSQCCNLLEVSEHFMHSFADKLHRDADIFSSRTQHFLTVPKLLTNFYCT